MPLITWERIKGCAAETTHPFIVLGAKENLNIKQFQIKSNVFEEIKLEDVDMRPLSLLIKPVSGLCNLRCRYCFYTDEMSKRTKASFGVMTRETLSCLLSRAFEYAAGPVTLAFQGGEPTLAGLDFYCSLVSQVREYNANGLPVSYVLQTNGTLIDDEWAAFFAEHKFLVGLSLDGPKYIHDKYRVDTEGNGSYEKVMEAAAVLRKHNVDFNILSVVTGRTAERAEKVYQFFKQKKLPYQQYIPCLDPLEEEMGQEEFSLVPEKYARFLKVLFDKWYHDFTSGNYVYNRYFENLIAMLMSRSPESCGMAGECSLQNVVEADGSVYPCDFYVLDRYCLGNIHTSSFEEIQRNYSMSGFAQESQGLNEKCCKCKWLFICRGGCRRNRLLRGENSGLNYYCTAYYEFFEYAMPRMLEICRYIVSQTK